MLAILDELPDVTEDGDVTAYWDSVFGAVQ
jgi:hypothetical protein